MQLTARSPTVTPAEPDPYPWTRIVTTPKKNVVQYAEEDLGVHDVWQEAQSRLVEHLGAQEQVAAYSQSIRALKREMQDREFELISEHRATRQELSDTAFQKYMKQVLHDDSAMTQMRSDLELAENNKEDALAEVRHHELGIRATSARMDELAGLLQFYAAAKAKE